MTIERSPVTDDALSIGLRDDGDAFSAKRRTPGRVQALPPAVLPGAPPCLVQAASNRAAATAAQHLFIPALLAAGAPISRGPLGRRGAYRVLAQRERVGLLRLPQPVDRVELIRLRLRESDLGIEQQRQRGDAG